VISAGEDATIRIWKTLEAEIVKVKHKIFRKYGYLSLSSPLTLAFPEPILRQSKVMAGYPFWIYWEEPWLITFILRLKTEENQIKSKVETRSSKYMMCAYQKTKDSSAACQAIMFWYIAWTNYRKRLLKTFSPSTSKRVKMKKY
jgi:hypothetical protein